MSYRDLIVHVDADRGCPDRLSVATDLARRFDAHLFGIYVDPGMQMPVVIDGPISPELIERNEHDRKQRRADAKRNFDAAMSKAGIDGEWREVRGDHAIELARQGRYVDLAVIGQQDDDSGVPYWAPDSLVVDCPRPVLLVPYIGAKRPVGGRVLVAWNSTREAVRAIGDAMPLLVGADEVEIAWVNPEGGETDDSALPGAEISHHLARHGVKATAKTLKAPDIDVADALLSHAADRDVDLIVMGAYGHSRLREVALGGATRDILQQMTVPVMMSH